MITAKILLSCGLLCAASAVHAACTYPKPPQDLPDGKTATTEQMLASQKDVKDYVALMQEYLECIDAEVVALGDEATPERILITNKRHNAAVEVMDEVTGEFNQAVRDYKERNN